MSENADLPAAPDTGPSSGRTPAKVLLSYVLSFVPMILLGIAAAGALPWATEVIAPTTRQNAVISQHGCSFGSCCAGLSWSGTCAWADDGRALDIGTYNRKSLVVPGFEAEPVVVHRSAFTGRVIGVRSAEEYAEFRATEVLWMFFYLVLVALPSTAAAIALRRRLRLARPYPRPLVMISVLVATAVPVGAWNLRGPEIAGARQLPDAMGDYAAAPPPDRIVRIGEVIETGDDIAFEVTGPAVAAPPTGSPAWLRDFHMVTIPVRTRIVGDVSGRDASGHHRLSLIGTGRGLTRLVTDPPCDAALRTFDGMATVSTPPIIGPLCFVVPTGFRPRYLVVDTETGSETDETARQDDVAVALSTG